MKSNSPKGPKWEASQPACGRIAKPERCAIPSTLCICEVAKLIQTVVTHMSRTSGSNHTSRIRWGSFNSASVKCKWTECNERVLVAVAGPWKAHLQIPCGKTQRSALTFQFLFLIASLFLVAMPGAPSSVLAPSSMARSP